MLKETATMAQAITKDPEQHVKGKKREPSQTLVSIVARSGAQIASKSSVSSPGYSQAADR